jgi:hypothetical protein
MGASYDKAVQAPGLAGPAALAAMVVTYPASYYARNAPERVLGFLVYALQYGGHEQGGVGDPGAQGCAEEVAGRSGVGEAELCQGLSPCVKRPYERRA